MQPTDNLLTLSIVIPVWNDPAGLSRLLHQLLSLPNVTQIIVVDDASEPPCTPESINLPQGAAGDPRLVWLRSETRSGAGHARNIGLAQVNEPHVLFFDSDDLLLPEFSNLLDDLTAIVGQSSTAPPFDFCLFRHADSRMAADNPAPLACDQRHWNAISVPETPTLLTPPQSARICRISAYPWNKIYRTTFLLDHNIRCTEIMVHNDLELHWTSFLRSSNIFASSRLCCEHFVHKAGRRLTNRSGAERFEVFQALEAVQADIALDAARTLAFVEAAVDFYLNLFHWISSVVEPDLRGPFHRKAQNFIRHAISLPIFTVIATADPNLARRLNRFLSDPAP